MIITMSCSFCYILYFSYSLDLFSGVRKFQSYQHCDYGHYVKLVVDVPFLLTLRSICKMTSAHVIELKLISSKYSAQFTFDLFHWNVSLIVKDLISQSFKSFSLLFFLFLDVPFYPLNYNSFPVIFFLFYSMAHFYHSFCNRRSWRCIFIVWRPLHMFKICWPHECFQWIVQSFSNE